MILEYMQHVFEVDLTEAEMKIVEEELQLELGRADKLRVWRVAAAKKKTQLLDHTNSNLYLFLEKTEEELGGFGEVGGWMAPKLTKLDFPRYDGSEDPTLWICRAEQFFDFQATAPNDQVRLAAY